MVRTCRFLMLILGTFSLVLIGCSRVVGSEGDANIDDCLNMPATEKEDQYICLKGIVVSKTQSPQAKGKAFSLLLEEWKHRDGAAGYYLSDNFLDILCAEPTLFFSVMKENPEEYDAWLSELDVFSFTWFGDPPSPLEQRRLDLIKYLEGIKNLDKDIDPLRLRLIQALRKIKPRIVD